jgi:hypothetical protein
VSLPPTEELSRPGGRVLRYCLYGPADGVPVISHSGRRAAGGHLPGPDVYAEVFDWLATG